MTADTKIKAVKMEVTLPSKGMVFKGEETSHRSFLNDNKTGEM